MGDVIAAVGVRGEALRSLGRPLDRTAHLLGRPGADGLLRVAEDLGAEAAADIGRDHPQLVLVEAEHEGAEDELQEVRVLAGRVERVVVGAAVVRSHKRRVGTEYVGTCRYRWSPSHKKNKT